MSPVSEAAFEAHIAGWLVEHDGYRQVKLGNTGTGPSHFDPVVGVDTVDLFAFIAATQSEQWAQLVSAGYGGNINQARKGFAKRLAKQARQVGNSSCTAAGE